MERSLVPARPARDGGHSERVAPAAGGVALLCAARRHLSARDTFRPHARIFGPACLAAGTGAGFGLLVVSVVACPIRQGALARQRKPVLDLGRVMQLSNTQLGLCLRHRAQLHHRASHIVSTSSTDAFGEAPWSGILSGRRWSAGASWTSDLAPSAVLAQRGALLPMTPPWSG